MDRVREWIDLYADAVGVDAPSSSTVDDLLSLAGTAAHASERQAAPITCWLAARAGLPPEAARQIAEALASSIERDRDPGP